MRQGLERRVVSSPLYHRFRTHASREKPKRCPLYCTVLAQLLSRPKHVVASGGNALSVDAGVEGVGSTRRPVHHGGGQQVVRGRGGNATKKLAPVGAAD